MDSYSIICVFRMIENNDNIISLNKMAQKKSDCDYMVKLLIIGDSGVGKTCLLMRFCESSFTNNHLTTIGNVGN